MYRAEWIHCTAVERVDCGTAQCSALKCSVPTNVHIQDGDVNNTDKDECQHRLVLGEINYQYNRIHDTCRVLSNFYSTVSDVRHMV